MVKPERRTRGDLLAAAAIALAVVVGAALIWWTSDARATLSRPAATPAPTLTPANAVPASLHQLWTARSPKTTTPVVVAGNVVTGDGREMVGRDPATGELRWSFARDRELCGISWVYELAVAVYPDPRGCGQVSGVNARTGKRGPTRSSYADDHVALSTDGVTVLSAGPTRIEMWRSDLVRTLAFGALDAPLNPPPDPLARPCRFLSTGASSSAASILEDCPDDEGSVRLTLLRVSDDDVVPEQRFVVQHELKADSGAKVLAVADVLTALYLPTPRPRVVVVNDLGEETSSVLLPRAPAPDSAVSRSGSLITFWTGDTVIAMDSTTLAYRFTVGAGAATPMGPGEMMANQLLIPVTDGIAVVAPDTGELDRVIPVDRGAQNGPITLGVAGSNVIEQRGDVVAALGA